MATEVFVSRPESLAEIIIDPHRITSSRREHVARLQIEKLYLTRQIGASCWSPDGRQIAFISNISGRNNLWVMALDEALDLPGWPVQLTISNQRQTSPAWAPNGEWIAFISDHDGDEQWDIFIVSPRTGEVINLTNTPAISEEHPAWSPDSRFLAYQVKPQDSPTFEIHVIDIATRQARPLTQGTPKHLGNFGPRWSPDGKWIAYTQVNAAGKDANIFIANLATSEQRLLTPHDDERMYDLADWSPDGAKLLITSNAANGYDNVGVLEIAAQRIEWLTQVKWEISAGSFSPRVAPDRNAKLITWTANIDGNSQVFVYEIGSRQASALELPRGWNALAGSESSFSPDGKRLLFYHNGATAPNDLWIYESPLRRARQVTQSLVAGLSSEDMVEPFLVHFPSRDHKWEISSLVYVPHNIERDGAHPAIVYVHGGPQAQTV